MKIDNIEFTDEEMNTAVKEMLKLRGMDLEVVGVEAKGYPRRGWEICVKAWDKETEEPKPQNAPPLPMARPPTTVAEASEEPI